MFYIKDSYYLSEKIGHEQNGDRAIKLVFETKPSNSNKVTVYCVLDGVSTALDRYSSSLAAAVICKNMATLFADINEVSRQEPEERMLYFYNLMREAILEADKTLFEDEKYCATTVSMAIVHDKYLYTANIGDSPIYLLDVNSEEMDELYTSHSEAAMAVRRGEIDKSEMHKYARKNIILKSVGGKARLTSLDIPTKRTLLNEDSILLLGSDGALSVFSSDELREFVLSHKDDMKALCESLHEKVLKAGGKDDFTVMAERIEALI